MIYYTADLHLGHEAILSMCSRPFSSVAAMDETLIRNWNGRVHADDTVYILGDLIYRAGVPPEEYLRRLRGRKRLIVGNHDASWLKTEGAARFFEEICRLDVINTGCGKATLCHFPMLDHEGHYLIHGHIHANTDQPYWPLLRASDRALNAGVDVNGFRPVTFAELLENNAAFKAAHP